MLSMPILIRLEQDFQRAYKRLVFQHQPANTICLACTKRDRFCSLWVVWNCDPPLEGGQARGPSISSLGLRREVFENRIRAIYCGENHFKNDPHFAFFIWPTAAFISALSWSLVLSFIALVAVILTMFLLIPVSCTFVIISSLRLKIYLVYSCLW